MLFANDICIEGVRAGGRKIAASVSARIVEDGVGDPFAQVSTATECENICAFFRAFDWPEVDPPQVGDTITTDDDKEYAVRRVTRLADCFCLTARSV